MSTPDKVMKLIALAGSDQPEEARTAAHAACRLIREHGFKVVDGKQAPPPGGSYSNTWGYQKKPKPDDGPVVITAKFDSLCVECRFRIHAGETCYWQRPQGVWHIDCDAAIRAARGES